jgi:hypothetical protein
MATYLEKEMALTAVMIVHAKKGSCRDSNAGPLASCAWVYPKRAGCLLDWVVGEGAGEHLTIIPLADRLLDWWWCEGLTDQLTPQDRSRDL